jgi:2-polyprenyl-6-methoxyphenol hydroxylase-like FAD-dependent oxidoreductase
MPTSTYDIVIAGSGPIGSATAYLLRDTKQRIAILSPEPLENDPDHRATYMYAGGSIRWYFENTSVASATQKTAECIRTLIDSGIDLSAIEDRYVFLHRGVSAPSYNVSGAKLVEYFLAQAEQSGVERLKNTTLQTFEKKNARFL